MTLSAPFPWFGGKSRAAGLIWQRFGNVPNYIEPFAGSLAVLLARPHSPQVETVNDQDAYLANFWRAVQADPDAVADACDWPVSEADLHARHVWLLEQSEFRERMLTDPAYFDIKIAGWWVWGLSLWIGSGWCDTNERTNERTGVHRGRFRNSAADAVSIAPASSHRGRGTRCAPTDRPTDRPRHGNCPSCQAPGWASPSGLGGFFDDLAARLRDVRIICGDWTRVLGPSVTTRHGVTAILLDPPYADDGHAIHYAGGGANIARDVEAWAVANGDNPDLRIALCGYESDYAMPSSWDCVPWKARGGYGSQSNGRGRENAGRERIWFSPHCLGRHDLFSVEQSA